MKRKRLLHILLGFLAGLSLLFCAKQGFPPGGPQDRTPPEVIRTVPVSGAIHVDPGIKVQIWFSEGVKPVSAKDAIFITPYPGEKVKYKFRGKKLTVSFPRLLEPDRTYVITLGTGIRDYRNNAMKASYTLAFSTGAVLDRGRIYGEVFGLKERSGIDVWAYRIADSGPDPSSKEPEYIVQCGIEGDFTFSHISPGIYRLFAVKDKWSDRLYQPGEDEMGIPYRDMLLRIDQPEPTDSLFFKITLEDTSGPAFTRAVSRDRHHLMLYFDETVRLLKDQTSASITIISRKDSTDSLKVKSVYTDPVKPAILHMRTQIQDGDKVYAVKVHDLWDEAGNPVDTAFNQIHFSGSLYPDTTKPKLIKIAPKPNERNAVLDGAISMTFDDAMDSVCFKDGFLLSDTLLGPVKGSFLWTSPASITFLPESRLHSQTTYEVKLLGEGIMDLAGNALTDTLFLFRTMNKDTLSAILGSVFDPDSEAVGNIFLSARHAKNPNIFYTQMIQDPEEYRFENILPGNYLIECFRDRDGNGVYSFGKASPFQPAERFVVYKDTVKVRSRWPNDGNDLWLPQ